MDYTEITPDFIDPEKLQTYLQLKEKLNTRLSEAEKNVLHSRGNPYELVGRHIFASRDGLKLASLDKMFDFAISEETKFSKRQEKTMSPRKSNALSRSEPPFTFVDIGGTSCGISDYLIWRKGYYNAKGFISSKISGLEEFSRRKKFMQPGSINFLNIHTCPVNNGDMNCMKNVETFVNYVKSELERHKTTKKGDEFVNFVSALGCYYPNGLGMQQEIHHQKLFLGNCLAGLLLARQNTGNMLIRAFDIFTPVTVGFVYCLYLAFHQITIVKPVTCRPKSTEQFIFCQKLTPFGATVIKDYLGEALRQWDALPESQALTTIVPVDFMKKDTRFSEYILGYNRVAVHRQTCYIRFYDECSRDSRLCAPNTNQIRDLAIKHWELGPSEPLDSRIFLPIETFVSSRADKTWNRRAYHPVPTKFNAKEFPPTMRFYVTKLIFRTTKFALVASNSYGAYFYLLDTNVGFVQTMFTGPPFTIFLVEAHPNLFKPNMSSLVVHDAGFLAKDAISHLPLLQRLNAAQKFAKTAQISYNYLKPIILQVQKPLRLTPEKIFNRCRITRVLPVSSKTDFNDDLSSTCETMSVLSFSSCKSQQSQKGGQNRKAERFWTSLINGNSWIKF